MDTVIVTDPAASTSNTIAAAQPKAVAIPTEEWRSHKWLHWGDDCGEVSEYRIKRNATLAPIAAAFFAGGEEAVIKAACGSNHCDIMRCWELAMTSVYGPTGLHSSWCDERDRPTAECFAKLSAVREAVFGSRERLRTFLAVYG